MIATTPLALVSGALTLIGVLDPDDALSPGMGSRAFDRLNSLIDSWALQRGTIYTIARSTYTLTANVGSFTIGVGGTFNQARPIWIDHASYIIPDSDPDTEVPLPLDTEQSYQAESQKALTSDYPLKLYYNPTAASGFGTIIPWPIQTQNLTLVLYTPTAVTQFTSLAQSVLLPPGYDLGIRSNLAKMLAPELGRPLRPDVEDMATTSLQTIKQTNYRMADLSIDAALWPGHAGVYNIYTDVP